MKTIKNLITIRQQGIDLKLEKICEVLQHQLALLKTLLTNNVDDIDDPLNQPLKTVQKVEDMDQKLQNVTALRKSIVSFHVKKFIQPDNVFNHLEA